MSQTVYSLGCLDNLIALKGVCADETSLSTLWVNDLGIDKSFIGQIITKDYVNDLDFFTRKRNYAAKVVANQVHNHLKPKYKAATVVENLRVGYYEDDLKQIMGNGKLKGIEIDICQGVSYLNLFLSEVALQINSTQSVDVLVYDLIQNKLIDTITIDCVADEITKVFANKTYASDRKNLNLFIGYDSTGISANTSRLKQNCRNCGGSYYKELTNAYTKIRAAEIAIADPKIKVNLDYINDTGGLSLVHSLSCDHESWMCSISNQLAFPILYKTCAEIFEHALNAKDQRSNSSVTINAEQIQKRFDRVDFLYAESMNNLLQNIKPPHDSLCFMCKDNVRHQVVLP